MILLKMLTRKSASEPPEQADFAISPELVSMILPAGEEKDIGPLSLVYLHTREQPIKCKGDVAQIMAMLSEVKETQ